MDASSLFFDYQDLDGSPRILARTGHVVHIWGPSGSGKSTLLSRVWGSRRVRNGHLTVQTQGQTLDLGTMEPARFAFVRSRLMTYVAQHTPVLPRIKVSSWFDHLDPPSVNAGLELLDVPASLLNRYACDVSGGELQRLILLRAYFSRTPILLFDEPCTGLDPTRREAVTTLLMKARACQKLVIYTSHTRACWVDQSIHLTGYNADIFTT